MIMPVETHNVSTLKQSLFNCSKHQPPVGAMWRASRERNGTEIPRSRAMWRSPPPRDEKIDRPWKQRQLKYHLQSIKHLLLRDEIPQAHLERLRKLAVKVFNNRSNSVFLYAIKHSMVNSEDDSEKAQHFTVVLQETNCMKFHKIAPESCEPKNESAPMYECEFVMHGENSPFDTPEVDMEQCYRVPDLASSVSSAGPVNKKLLLAEVVRNVSQDLGQKYVVHSVQSMKIKSLSSGVQLELFLELEPASSMRSNEHLAYARKNLLLCEANVVLSTAGEDQQKNETNCWFRSPIENTFKSELKELKSEAVQSAEIQSLLDRTLARIKGTNVSRSGWQVDYVTEGRQFIVDNGSRKQTFFTLHLKDSQTDEQMSCDIATTGGDELLVLGCEEEKKVRPVLGGQRVLDEEELQQPEYQDLLHRIVNRYNEQGNSAFLYRARSIVNATTQIVAGRMLRIELHLEETGCSKNDHKDLFLNGKYAACDSVEVPHLELCKVSVLQQPWLNNREEIKFINCTRLPTDSIKRLGAPEPMNDEMLAQKSVQALVENAIHTFNLQVDSPTFYRHYTVENAKKQIVAGTLYSFILVLKPTACKKPSQAAKYYTKAYEQCGELENQELILCKVEIVSQPWMEISQKIKLDKCVRVRPFEKKKLFGGRRPLSKDEQSSPWFTQLVERAVSLFNKNTKGVVQYKSHFIEEPSRQIVAGASIRFKLHLIPENQKKDDTSCCEETAAHVVSCDAHVWSRPWLLNSELIELEGCEMTWFPNSTGSWQSKGGSPELDSKWFRQLISSLILMFNKWSGLNETYEYYSTEYMKTKVVAGRLLQFDLYLEPRNKPITCKDEQYQGVSFRWCDIERFVQCKVTVWQRPWLSNSSLINLTECDLVQPEHPFGAEIDWTRTSDIVRADVDRLAVSAAQLYQSMPGVKDQYVILKTFNITRQISTGIRTTFDVELMPSEVDEPRQKHTVKCTVHSNESPWLGMTGRLAIKHCRKHFPPGEYSMPIEEQTTEDFQQIKETLQSLFGKQNQPFLYALERVESVNVITSDNTRQINLTVVFKPIGCNLSAPNTNEFNCTNWQEKEEVTCKASVMEKFDEGNYRTISFQSCRRMWLPKPKHSLSAAEMASSKFQSFIANAVRSHQKISKRAYLFKIVEIKDATLERADQEIVEFKLVLKMTKCGLDSTKATDLGTAPEGCVVDENEAISECSTKMTAKSDGHQFQQTKCFFRNQKV